MCCLVLDGWNSVLFQSLLLLSCRIERRKIFLLFFCSCSVISWLWRHFNRNSNMELRIFNESENRNLPPAGPELRLLDICYHFSHLCEFSPFYFNLSWKWSRSACITAFLGRHVNLWRTEGNKWEKSSNLLKSSPFTPLSSYPAWKIKKKINRETRR